MNIFKWEEDKSDPKLEIHKLSYAYGLWEAEVGYDPGSESGFLSAGSQKGWFHLILFNGQLSFKSDQVRFATKEHAKFNVEVIIKAQCQAIVEASKDVK